MTDADFLAAFEDGRIAPADFHHCEHVRLAWLYLVRDGLERGSARMAAAIRAFATAAGKPALYRQDLTDAWLGRVWKVHEAESEDAAGPSSSFDDFAARHPELLRKELVAAGAAPSEGATS